MTGPGLGPEATPDRVRRAVLAGGSGFVGTALSASLEERGYAMARIGRRGPDATWGDAAGIARLVDGADLLVNLAGKSVGCRYTDANRDEILASRVETTRQLHDAVRTAGRPPRLWLNASTATIYRHAMDRPQTEADGEIGAGFSVDVARSWERTFFAGDLPRTRRVALRMAIVLGNGSALTLLQRVARLGLGGPQHDGWWFPHRRYRGIGDAPSGPPRSGWHRSRARQKFSWIHIDDLLAAVTFVDEHPELTGPVNLAAPGTSDNTELMRLLRASLRVPVGLPAYRWMLEPALFVLRQEAELLLKSRWAVPAKLTNAGFTFRWPELGPALDDLA